MAIIKGKKITPETSKTGGVKYADPSKQASVSRGSSTTPTPAPTSSASSATTAPNTNNIGADNQARAKALGYDIPGVKTPTTPIITTDEGGTEDNIRYPRVTTTGAEADARSVLYDTEDFDEGKARRDALRGASGQIKAIDDVYNRRVQDERKLGQKDLARSNTISAMTGMAGAPEASTRGGNADRRTEDRVAVVEEQRALAIADIYSKIDDNVRREKEAHLDTQRENSKRVLEEVANNAKSALNNFAAQGLSWEAIEKADPESLDTLIRQSGADPFELRILYNDSLPADKKPQTLFEGFKGDNFIRIMQNSDGTTSTMTKSAADLGIPKDVDVATITLGDSVYWYDKNNPMNESGTPNLTRLGAKDAPKGTDDTDTTPTEDRTIERAGLDEAPKEVKDLFLATPTAFRQAYQKEVAQGKGVSTVEEMLLKLEEWETAKSGGTEDWAALLGE